MICYVAGHTACIIISMDATNALSDYTSDLLAGDLSVAESARRIEDIREKYTLSRKVFRSLFLDEFNRQASAM